MIRLIWTLSAHTRYYLRRHMPTNRLLDEIRRRRNLKWGIPAMLLAVPYLLIASICTNALDQGAPGEIQPQVETIDHQGEQRSQHQHDRDDAGQQPRLHEVNYPFFGRHEGLL